MMPALLILWAGLTTVLVILLIYRSTLSMHEDDQLFLFAADHVGRVQQLEQFDELRFLMLGLVQSISHAEKVGDLGEYLRFGGTLPGDIRELAILITARSVNQAYEWVAHARIAKT